jgi:hypothetical protein
MTSRSLDASRRWWGLLLAALVAVLVTLFGAGTASAATATAAQTRVGPHTLIAQVLVGPGSGIGAGQRLGNDPPAYDFVLATGVAAKAETAVAGPARDALGRFTSGAGGESAAASAGRSAHQSYENTLGGGDWVFNRGLPGSRGALRPDAVSYSTRVVRELKPDNPGAISSGWRQVTGYQNYLQELTGKSWTSYVDVYKP